MCFIKIHAWDPILQKYVDVDSFYVDLDNHKTHQLKRTIIADEWKISWKLVPPPALKSSDLGNEIKLPPMPSSFELAKLIRVDSQLHVGPLFTHFKININKANITICNRTNDGLKEELFYVTSYDIKMSVGTWNNLKGAPLFQAIKFKMGDLALVMCNPPM